MTKRRIDIFLGYGLGAVAALLCLAPLHAAKPTPQVEKDRVWEEPITGMKLILPEGSQIQFDHDGIDAAIVGKNYVFRMKFERLDRWVGPQDILNAKLQHFRAKHKERPKDELIKAMEADARNRFQQTDMDTKKTLGLQKALFSEQDNIALVYPGGTIIAKSWLEDEKDKLKPTLLARVGGSPARTWICAIPYQRFGIRMGQQKKPLAIKEPIKKNKPLDQVKNTKPAIKESGLFAQSLIASDSGYLISITTEIAAEHKASVLPVFKALLAKASFIPWQRIAEKRVEEQNAALAWYEKVDNKLRQSVLLPRQWYRIVDKRRTDQGTLVKDVGWMLIKEQWISRELAAKLKKKPGSPIKEAGFAISMAVNQLAYTPDSEGAKYQLNISEFFLDEKGEVETWNIRSRRPKMLGEGEKGKGMYKGLDYAEEVGFRFGDTLTVSRRTDQGLEEKNWELPARQLQREQMRKRPGNSQLKQNPDNIDPRLKKLRDRPEMAGVYMSMVDVFLKFRMLGRLRSELDFPLTMSFYAYAPTKGKLSYRRDVIQEAENSNLAIMSRPTLASSPQWTLLDRNGYLISHQLLSGHEIIPISEPRIMKLWEKDPDIKRYKGK